VSLDLLWRGVAVVYASEAGRRPAERVAELLRAAGVAAYVFRYGQLEDVWGCYDAYVFVMALGGVVRWLCGRLVDKAADPPVVVVPHDLSHVVPVVGMHRGANGMAIELAKLLGATPVLTTAAEAAGFAPVEDLERALLCGLDPRDALEVYRALTLGKTVCVEAPLPRPLPGYRQGNDCDVVVKVGCDGEMCCRPWKIYAGFGATSAATVEDIVEAILQAMKAVGATTLEAVASIKPLVYQVAERLGTRPILLNPGQLASDRCLSPPLEIAEATVGAGNVAEASALAAAGPRGFLLYRKRSYKRRVTVAIAAST